MNVLQGMDRYRKEVVQVSTFKIYLYDNYFRVSKYSLGITEFQPANNIICHHHLVNGCIKLPNV